MTTRFHVARCIRLWLALLCLAECCSCGVAAKTVSGKIEFNGSHYSYAVFVPSTHDATHPMPAILLVHGAGGNGLDFLNLWRDFAQKSGIILVAPTLPSGDRGAELESQVPQMFRDLMEIVKKQWNVDPQRIYLFGYSAGGYFTFDTAMMDSTYFAAAGVFAARITPDFEWIVQKAQRKMPIALYVGDHDPFFSLEQTRGTRDLLRANGFTVHYVEILNQNHNYPAISDRVNRDAWAFLRQYSLPH